MVVQLRWHFWRLERRVVLRCIGDESGRRATSSRVHLFQKDLQLSGQIFDVGSVFLLDRSILVLFVGQLGTQLVQSLLFLGQLFRKRLVGLLQLGQLGTQRLDLFAKSQISFCHLNPSQPQDWLTSALDESLAFSKRLVLA